MTITRTGSNGTQWTVAFASWQFVSAVCAVITISLALIAPWVDWRASSTFDQKALPIASQVKTDAARIERVEQLASDAAMMVTQQQALQTQRYNDLRDDIKELRVILLDGKRR